MENSTIQDIAQDGSVGLDAQTQRFLLSTLIGSDVSFDVSQNRVDHNHFCQVIPRFARFGCSPGRSDSSTSFGQGTEQK